MANVGQIESLLNGLPAEQKRVEMALVRYAFKNLRIGAPPEEPGAGASENFAASLIRFVTSSVANAENAVPHRLDRPPRFLIPCLLLDTVNDTVPVLTVTRAADSSFFYVKSPSMNAEMLVYVE